MRLETRNLLRSRAGAALLLVTAIGAALRFGTLGQQSFWYDESVTVSLLELPLHELLTGIADNESTPPLYYLLAWLWAKVAGTEEYGLRALSALVGTLTIPIAYAAARVLVSVQAALAAATLAAVSPVLIWYSQEARAYALLAFLGGVSFVLFALARSEPSTRRLAAWATVAGLALATHYFAAFVVLAQAAVLLWTHPRLVRARWAVASVLVVGAALVPLAAVQARHRRLGWIGGLDLGERVAEAVQRLVAAAPPSSWAGATGAMVRPHIWTAAALALVVAGALLLVRGSPRERAGGTTAFAVASLSIAAPIAIGLLADLVAGGDGDVFLDRNVLGSWVPLSVFVAAGLAARRAGVVGLACLAALVAWCAAVYVQVATSPDLHRDDWRGVAEALPADAVVVVYPAYQSAALVRQRPDLAPPTRPARTRTIALVLAGFDDAPPSFEAPPGFARSRTQAIQHFVLIDYSSQEESAVTGEDVARVPFEDSDLELLAAR